jgi:SOS-response transcriptional repressor LexA
MAQKGQRMDKLTKRQEEVLDFCRSWQKEKGFFPSMQQIAMSMGWTSTAASKSVLSVLVRKGSLRKVGRHHVLIQESKINWRKTLSDVIEGRMEWNDAIQLLSENPE